MGTPPCPICQHGETAEFPPRAGPPLRLCAQCRHVFRDTMPDARTVLSHHEEHYRQTRRRDADQTATRAYHRSHLAELARFAGTAVADLAIADIGCAEPVFLEEALLAGAPVAIGVDWPAETRADGAARGIPVLSPGDYLERVPDGALDVLRYSYILHRLPDPAAILCEQVRKLRPGGLVHVTQPNIPVLRFPPGAPDLPNAAWLGQSHFFSPLSLLTLARVAGLTPEMFFTVTDPEGSRARYGAEIDLDHARDHLADLAGMGEDGRGELNNYPFYLGYDCAIHLRAGHSRAGTGDAEDDAADPAHRRLAAAERRIGVLRTMVLMPRVAPPPLAPRGGAREEGGTTPTTDTARLWSTLRNIADLAFDSLAIAARAPHFVRPPRLEIRTAHPIALLSADHVHPRGTANDDTRHPRFVSACERRFPRPLSHLDLGCAGGGLVWDFLLAGHYSYGIEGSDFSRINRRGFWRVVPEQLFTADITEPFALLDAEGTPRDFHVITAWEVLEHLPEERLPGFLENIRRSLRGDGLFIASIATFPDEDAVTGAVWHVTIRPREWWLALFAAHGLRPCEAGFAIADHVRGSGNPRAQDWDARESPEMGFHVVLTHAEHVVPTHAEHVVLPHAEADRSGTDESGGAAP